MTTVETRKRSKKPRRTKSTTPAPSASEIVLNSMNISDGMKIAAALWDFERRHPSMQLEILSNYLLEARDEIEAESVRAFCQSTE